MKASFRLRITLWYAAFFSALMLCAGALLYGALSHALRARFDQTLTTECRTAAGLFLSELEEWKGDERNAANETIHELHPTDVQFAVFSSRELLSTNTGAPQGTLAQLASAAPSARALPIPYGAGGGRAVVERATAGQSEYRVAAFASVEGLEAQLALARRLLVFALPPLLLIGALGVYWIAVRSLRPLAAMTAQASAINDRNLEARLEIGRSAGELRELAQAFNALLSRLDHSFNAMRQFTADASHELRTPVTVIQTEAELALSRERSPEEYRQTLAAIHGESRRLARLVGDLLDLARADGGRARLNPRELYLNDVALECCRSLESLAAAAGVRLTCQAETDAPCTGDEDLLRRLVCSLVDNAVRYTPSGGSVAVSVARDGEALALRVADTGIGIAPEALPRLFERFYRAEAARARHQGGFGLGLAIVKWIAELHQGSVTAESEPGRGSVFTVRLPAAR